MENIESTEKIKTEPLQPCDPLEGLGDEIPSPHYYRVNCDVFAEPLDSKTAVTNIDDQKDVDTVIMLNDNVIVKKRTGKGKRLFLHLHDQSDLDCPMRNCSKSFSTPSFLKTHIRKVHCSEKTHTCEVCGAGFAAAYLLRRHSAVHGAERAQCPVCNKMLSLRTNLAQHLRSHSDTRRHQCPVCDKRFLRASTLKVHLGNAHKQNP